MSLARLFGIARPTVRSSLFKFQRRTFAASAQELEAIGEEPNEDQTDLNADELTRKEILAEHPHEHPEDVLAAYALPRNVLQPLIGPFGTRKRPTLVPSGHDSRIIACTGGHSPLPGIGQPHDAAWLVVRDDNKKYACDICGQVFKLLRLKGTKHDHHGHH